MPKISVIIPVYNSEKYLRQCLDSVINQTLKDIEIICVNDGSTDGSLEILNEYAKKDERVKVIPQENQGVSVARNAGLNIAQGEYIMFLDSDDMFDPKCCKCAYETIKNTNSDVCQFGGFIIDKLGKKIKELHYNYYLSKDFYDLTLKEQIIQNINVWNKIFKKSFIDKFSLKFCEDLSLSEDRVFCINLWLLGAKYHNLNCNLYYQLRDSKSLTTGNINIIKNELKALKALSASNIFIQANKNIQEDIITSSIDGVLYLFDKNHDLQYAFMNDLKTYKDFLLQNFHFSDSEYIAYLKKIDKYSSVSHYLEKLFSIKNENNHKVLNILGLKIKIKYNKDLKLQNKCQKYLIKKYIKPYFKGKLNHYEFVPKINLGTDKIIWQYWGQGINNTTPKIIKVCFNSVNKYKGDYVQIILTKDNISKYIDLPEFIYEKLDNKEISHVFFSDILRLCLLSTYGGIWIDATILLTGAIPKCWLNKEFFTYERLKKSLNSKKFNKQFGDSYFNWSKKHKINWLNSFIIASKNYPLIDILKDLELNYFKNEKNIYHYFLMQIMFDYLIKNTDYKKYNCEIIDDTLPHLMQLNFYNTFSTELWNSIVSQSHIHKLTYKFKDLKINTIGSHILENNYDNI